MYEEIGAVNNIVVYKKSKKLILFNNDMHIKTYTISLGSVPLGKKEKEADQKTPEGAYYIDWKHPNSSYHQALHISYPNKKERELAIKKETNPGGDIMLHGMPNYLGWLYPLFKGKDWINGCIAVSNVEIEEIVSAVETGTTITVYP